MSPNLYILIKDYYILKILFDKYIQNLIHQTYLKLKFTIFLSIGWSHINEWCHVYNTSPLFDIIILFLNLLTTTWFFLSLIGKKGQKNDSPFANVAANERSEFKDDCHVKRTEILGGCEDHNSLQLSLRDTPANRNKVYYYHYF